MIAGGAKVVVTTHLSALKAVAYTHPRADNASVEFDLKTLRPTYRVRMGEPGTSNAITIAQRLGMSHKLAQAARTHLEGQYHALDEAIKGTLHSRREAEEARKAAHTARVESMRIRDEYAAKQDELEQQRQSHQRWTQWVTGLRRGDPVYLKPVKCDWNSTYTWISSKRPSRTNSGTVDWHAPIESSDVTQRDPLRGQRSLTRCRQTV